MSPGKKAFFFRRPLPSPLPCGERGPLLPRGLELLCYCYQVGVVVAVRVVGVAKARHRGFDLFLELAAEAWPERVDQRVRQRAGACHQLRPFTGVTSPAT